MARINNTQRIVKEDYESDFHELIGKLAFVVNSFMEQTVTQINGNLDQTNFKSDIVTIKMTVDANGIPIGNNLIKSTVARPVGTTVLRAIDKTVLNSYATSQPFISFTYGANSSILKVLKISGLQANHEYDLVIKIE